MPRSVQYAGRRVRGARALLGLLAPCAVLAGCVGGMGLSKVETDPTILTSSVDASYAAMKSEQSISDQATIRNAVSSASLEDLGGKPLPWANAETNSRGTITRVAEARKQGLLCRTFQTSRESFDGVSVYTGEACLGRDGGWYMRSFERS